MVGRLLCGEREAAKRSAEAGGLWWIAWPGEYGGWLRGGEAAPRMA